MAALRRRHQADPVEGLADAVGERLRRHRRDRDRRGVRPAGGGAPLPGRDQGLLHGARPGAAGADRCPPTSWPPRATARSWAAASACRAAELLLQRIHEHKLPEEAFRWYIDLRTLRQRPPRRLRHGHRARRHLDLRPRAPARDDRLPADAVPDLPVATHSRRRLAARIFAPCRGLDREDQQRNHRTRSHPDERERFCSVRKHNHLHRRLNHEVQKGWRPDRVSSQFEEIRQREANDDREENGRERRLATALRRTGSGER